MPDILLKIIVNEQQHEKRDATCKKILTYLREQGVPGATMRRGEAGIDDRGGLSYDLLEDTYFNDLPIMIESVLDQAAAEKIEEGLNRMTAHGQISKMEGIDAKRIEAERIDEGAPGNHSWYAVKIFTRESGSKLIKKDEYEKILQLLQKHKAIWGTVAKAVAGYGRDGVIYGRHIFSPSEHLPLVIECIIGRDDLPLLMEELKTVVTEGAVFTAPVDLIINK